MVALVTPFRAGKVDEAALKRLLDFHLAEGTDVMVPCGTTGESTTLSHEEHMGVMSFVVDYVKGKVPVICGAGSNCTEEAVPLLKHAKKIGASGVLVVTPYYNRPTQEGLYRHYEAIAKAVDIPIILYNIPGRSGVAMTPETVARLSKIPTIVGIKEATGSMDQTSHILSLCDLTVLSGDDSLTLPLLSLGAKGVISVISNLLPEAVSGLVDAYFAGKHEKAQKIHYELFPLCRAMFIETNPIPVKRSMKLLGYCSDELRLPLCSISESNEKILIAALKNYGLKVKA